MIWIILFLGVVLRFIAIDQSLWLDEAISLVSAKNLTVLQIIYELTPSDVHPPGYYLLLRVWISFFTDSEVSARILSVIFGVGLIYITFILARRFFNKGTSYLAAILMAVSPLGVYYSQEIRMYSAAAFFSALSFLFLIQILENKKFAWIFYILSNFAVLSLDYMAYLIFPAQIVFLISLEKKKYLLKILSLLFISLLLVFPWLTLLPTQITKGQEVAKNLPAWSEIVGGVSFKDLGLFFAKNIIGRASFENKVVYAAIVGIFSLLYIYLLYLAWRVRGSKLFFLWLIIPLFLSLSISFILPIFSYHRFIFTLPALYILLAIGIFKLEKYRILAACLLILISLMSLIIFYTSPKYQREQWRQAVNLIKLNKSDAYVLFEDANTPPPFAYYKSENLIYFPGLLSVPAKSEKDIKELKMLDKNKDILVFEYLYQINDPRQLLIKEIESLGYKRVNTFDFPGVGFIYEYKYFDRM